jgi:lipid A 3-O-deacylase
MVMFRNMQASAILGFFLILFSLPLMAQSWSFSAENDAFFSSDGGYTGGLQAGWMSDDLDHSRRGSFGDRYVSALNNFVETLSPFELGTRRRSGAISVRGMAVTPEDTKVEAPIYDDVPYMGVTTATFSLFIWDERLFHEIRMAVGVFGPASGAGFTQKAWHRAIGNDEPKGWGNQLDNRLVLQAGYGFGLRQYEHRFAGGHVFEWFNSFSADAGSGYVGADAGTVLRIGRNVPKNFVTINGFFNHTLARQLYLESCPNTLGWDVNIGVAANAIGYFYLYEESKGEGYDFDRPSAVLTGRLGADLYYKTLQLSLELLPSRSLDRFKRFNDFGRISVIWWIP